MKSMFRIYVCLQKSLQINFQVWNRKQNELFEQASGRELVLAGDGRSDSPGHSAKYGTYTVVDVSTKKVLHVETVQVNFPCYKCSDASVLLE